jgi:hypothetical protein
MTFAWTNRRMALFGVAATGLALLAYALRWVG